MNNRPGRCIGVLVLLAVAASCVVRQADAQPATPPGPCQFFATVPDDSAGLQPGRIYPEGRRIPLSFLSPNGEADLDRLANAGFTMAGPANLMWPDHLSVIEEAGERGLKFAYQVEVRDLDFTTSPPDELDVASIRAAVEEQIDAIAAVPQRDAAVAWWSVYPDELRSWDSLEMEFLDVVTGAIRDAELANGRTPRPIWMYEPSNRASTNLAVTGERLDLVSKAAYVNIIVGADPTQSRAWVRSSVQHAVDAAEFLEKAEAAGAVPARAHAPLAVLDVDFDAGDSDDPALHRSRTRHDAYLSLVTGAKGILVYALPYAHDSVFDGYASVAHDLTGPFELGKVLLFGRRRGDITVEVVEGPATVTVRANPNGPSAGKSYPSIAFADIAIGSSRYLVAVNSSDQFVRAQVGGLPPSPVHADELFAGGGHDQIIFGGQFGTPFAPLEVKVFRFDMPGGVSCPPVPGLPH